MKKIMIATPMYGGFCAAGYTASMIELMRKYGSNKEVQIEFMYGVNEALVTRARNMCANIFLKSNSDYLLFIDSDIQFNADELFKMMQCNEEFVCGIYPKKNIDWEKVRVAALNGVPAQNLLSAGAEYLFIGDVSKRTPSGLVEIERAATGCMMIHRNVFKKLSDSIQNFKLEAPVNSNVVFQNQEEYKEYFFTAVDPDNKIFLHEDFNFCRLWRNVGGKIYGAPWVRLQHIGNYTFG